MFDPVVVVDEATSPLNNPFQQGPLRSSDSSPRPLRGNKGTQHFDPEAVVDEATSPLNNPFQQGPLRSSDSSPPPLRGNKGTQHVDPVLEKL